MKTTQYVVDPWYIEQERRITEATAEARRARALIRALYDPGHLYVVEFDSGVIKVGRADNAEARITTHHYAGLVRRYYVSPRHVHVAKTERRLIALCNEYGTLHGGREYFRDIDVNAVRAFAHLLVRNAQRRAYLDRLIEAADDDLSMTWQDAHDRLPVDEVEPDPAEADAEVGDDADRRERVA